MTALAAATALVFLATWALHSYQWFWIGPARAGLAALGALFFVALGAIVFLYLATRLASEYRQVRRLGPKRKPDPNAFVDAPELQDEIDRIYSQADETRTALNAATEALAAGAPGADDAYSEALDRWLALGAADVDALEQVFAQLGELPLEHPPQP